VSNWIHICGLQSSGKTEIIRALIRLAKKKGLNPAGYKPFDIGAIHYNANELDTDGELFCTEMNGEPTVNLVAPYLPNERYPFEMSLGREGVNVNQALLDKRKLLLGKIYNPVFVEGTKSLYTPINEKQVYLDFVKKNKGKVVWLISPFASDFESNLSELAHLKKEQIDCIVVLNNTAKSQDQDYFYYAWNKIQDYLDIPLVGLIPFTRDIQNNFEQFVDACEENISKEALDSLI
jgi:dethiobiotin synthetase